MRTRLTLKSSEALDEANSRHIKAALEFLNQGKVTEACQEIRQIQRAFAGHPAVVRLRQRLVEVVCGWNEQPAEGKAECAEA